MEINDLINALFGSWAGIVLAVIGVFSALATLLPAPSATSGTAYRILYRVLTWLACNVGKARNADDSPAATTNPRAGK